MDVLTLPVDGWALAYPSPHYDLAHMLHMPCGWRSEITRDPEFWRHQLDWLVGGHRCMPSAPLAQRRDDAVKALVAEAVLAS